MPELESKNLEHKHSSFAVVAIMRGESSYILEWVSYYRVLGVAKIVIYDNGGNGDLLSTLESCGFVTVVDWPTVENISPQLSAYNDAIGLLLGEVEFVAFFDADEFLVIDKSRNLQAWLGELPTTVGAIAVNQRVFGSSGNRIRGPGLVIERFQRACNVYHDECNWVKSIYRLEHVDKITNSHRGRLKQGQYILPNGVSAFGTDLEQPSRSQIVDFSIMQLNHYILKSEEEFNLKRERGAVMSASATHRAKRYKEYDFFGIRDAYSNVDKDTKILHFLEGVREEMAVIASCFQHLVPSESGVPLSTDGNGALSSEISALGSKAVISSAIKDKVPMISQREKLLNYEPWHEKTPEEVEAQKIYQDQLRSEVDIEIGVNTFISPMSFISGCVRVGKGTLISANAVLRGNVSIGDDCSVNVNAHIAGKVTVGNGVRVAPNASIFGFNHKFDDLRVPIYKQGLNYEGVSIGSNTWIGASALILDGVTIGAECIVAAGAVVASSFPPFSIIGGNPARLISNRAVDFLQKTDGQLPPGKVLPVRSKVFSADPYANFSDFRPIDLQGWGSYEAVFEHLLTAVKPRILVEVGTWKGASAIHQASIARRLGIECEIVCVDTWLGNWQHWSRSTGPGSRVDLATKNGFPTLYYQFLSNVIFMGFQNEITPLPLPGIAAAKLFAHLELEVDLIYIDGDHEYEAVSQDIRTWDAVLSRGGVLFGDDLHWPGVRRAVDDFVKESGREYQEIGGKFVFEPKN